jgi:hypothetical protein
MRRRSDREKMRSRVGLDEIILDVPREIALDNDKLLRWIEERAKRLHVPAGYRPMVSVLSGAIRFSGPQDPVRLRIYVEPRRDVSHLLARLLGTTTPRGPRDD